MNASHYFISKNSLDYLKNELKRRNFSQKTIQTYLYYNINFLKFANKTPKIVKNQDIRAYLNYLSEKHGYSTINLALNALKFYYRDILHRKFFVDIRGAKRDKKLPTVLSQEEIKKIIEVIQNPKHRLIIKFIYSTGVRVGEVVKIRVKDLALDRGLCYIRSGKGKKDRVVILARNLLEDLQNLIFSKTADDFLFTSQTGGNLSTRTIQKILKNAAQKAGIKKDFGVHALRHSFATHLLESGTDIRYIQELLGHKKLETTQVYTKVSMSKLSNLNNPLDLLIH